MILLSFRFHDRHHYQGYTSDLDNVFQSAQREGASTDRCLVVLVVRDVDAEFRDSAIAAQGAAEILGRAEERREYHIQRNGRWAAQLVSPRILCWLIYRMLTNRNDLYFV